MSKKYAEVNVVNGKTQALTEEQQNCDVLCVTMFEDEKDKRIAELEAKLAESEKLNKALYNKNQSADEYIHELNKLNSELQQKDEQLKQQLAEKDQTIETILKENEELVKQHNVYTWGDEIQQDKIYAITGEALEFLISNQDKISFAIEILEEIAGCSNYINTKPDFLCGYYVLEKVINDKIKWLKGTKDE